jgi:membrane fusion protein (multidrug efflux system)
MVDESQRSVNRAKNEASARNTEAQALAHSSRAASVMAGYRELRALNDAMVAERLVSPGAVVTAGEKLAMLHVADPLRVQANIPEDSAPGIAIGSVVHVSIRGKSREARITSVFPQADPVTRTVTVEALLPNADHSVLPGEFASLSVQGSPTSQALAVRSAAVQTAPDGRTFVWVAVSKPGTGATDWTCPMHTDVSEKGPGKCPVCQMPLVQRSRGGSLVATRKLVSTGATNGQYTGVSEGLAKGEQVIWVGLDDLYEGIPVEATETKPQVQAASAKPKLPSKGKPVWTCTMHPNVEQDHPGNCPICGMKLVLKGSKK